MSSRSYMRRGGRLRAGQIDALQRLWPAYGIAVDERPLDLPALFGRTAPVALEIGFGMGEATAAMAAARPELDVLAVEVHEPGRAALLRRIEAAGLTNVRIAEGDALVLLRDMLKPASVQEIRVFFPDPWPKRRHHKRRLVNADFVTLAAERLAPGGLLHVATDWPDYAEQVRALLDVAPAFAMSRQRPWRPTTLFERRGLTAGRVPEDIVAVRVS